MTLLQPSFPWQGSENKTSQTAESKCCLSGHCGSTKLNPSELPKTSQEATPGSTVTFIKCLHSEAKAHPELASGTEKKSYVFRGAICWLMRYTDSMKSFDDHMLTLSKVAHLKKLVYSISRNYYRMKNLQTKAQMATDLSNLRSLTPPEHIHSYPRA